MQCIYRKYCVRKGIRVVQCEFLVLIHKLGEMAYQIRKRGNFLKRKSVIYILGIMYPHKSIEEFFFTFHIINYMSQTIPC